MVEITGNFNKQNNTFEHVNFNNAPVSNQERDNLRAQESDFSSLRSFKKYLNSTDLKN